MQHTHDIIPQMFDQVLGRSYKRSLILCYIASIILQENFQSAQRFSRNLQQQNPYMIGYKMFKVGTFIQKFKMGSKLLSKFKICKIDCRARNPAWASFFLNLCHSLPIHSSFLSFQCCCSVFKFCRWPNSNRRPLMSEPTALPN